MKTSYFKAIGQKMGNGKVLVMMVMEENTITDDLPDIFELQAVLAPKTIYTGIYPTIKLNLQSIEDITKKFRGVGAAGIITGADWYNQTIEKDDALGIGI